MIETIISSSVLILAVVALRYLLRSRISSRLQYALWVLVAIRLLLPFSLFESPVSVMNALPYQPSYSANVVPTTAPAPVGSGNEALSGDFQINQNNSTITHKTDYRTVAIYLWLCGILVSGTIFLVSNVHLSRKLKQSRKQVGTPDCSLPVYTSEGLPSPCLYGLWKPSIYLTPESLTSDQRMAHVITHELTHYHHGDHIWSFVRALCVCVHWFNPLVWLAAILSRRDSELACDEGTLSKLGDESRTAYGKTLIEMMTTPSKPTDLFRCATTMTGGKREIAERIKRIAQKPKMLLITFVAVLLIAVIAVVSAFSGAASVALMEAAGGFTLETLDSVEYGTLISDNKIMDLPKAKAEEITDYIKELRVSKKEVTKVRKNDRDSTNQIHLVYSGFASNEPRNIYLNFNRDFSQVWVNNEVKPSLSYAVKKPKEVKAFFDRQFGSTTTPIEIGSAEELWKARTQYIGDNSAVGKLIGLLPAPEDVRYDHFELHTSEQPYDIEIVYSASSAVLKQYDTEEARKSNPFRKNALILLALVDNANGVRAVLTDGKREVGFINTREWADYTVSEDVRNYAESPEKLQELIGFPLSPNNTLVKIENTNSSQQWDLRPMLMHDGTIYLDTGKQIPAEIDDSSMLGEISSSVDSTKKPSENGQSNFGAVGAKYAAYEDDIVILLNNKWFIFEKE